MIYAAGVVAVFSFWFFVFSNGTWTRYWDWGDCLNCDLGGFEGWAVICAWMVFRVGALERFSG